MGEKCHNKVEPIDEHQEKITFWSSTMGELQQQSSQKQIILACQWPKPLSEAGLVAQGD